MAIRRISTPSERGSIKNLVNSHEDEILNQEFPPTPSELRYKKLYEYAKIYNDTNLTQALGIITTEYISDKNALPLSVYRLRQVVADIKSKFGSEIEKLEQQILGHLSCGIDELAVAYIKHRQLIKTAGARKPPVFRRVSVL